MREFLPECDMEVARLVTAAAVASRVNVILVGPPGGGKTSFVLDMAGSKSLHVEVLALGTKAPEDLGGFPRPVQVDGNKWAVDVLAPGWVNRLARFDDEDRLRAILFLDEINHAPPDVARLAQPLLSHRIVADHFRVPRSVAIVGAMNSADEVTGGVADLEPAVVTRCCFVRWEPTPADKLKGLRFGWGRAPHLTEIDESAVRTARQRVVEFLSVDGNSESFLGDRPLRVALEDWRGQPVPTGRGWENVMRFLSAVESMALDADTRVRVIEVGVSGLVGRDGAAALVEYLRRTPLPTPQEVVDGTSSLPGLDTLRPGEARGWCLSAGQMIVDWPADACLTLAKVVHDAWGGVVATDVAAGVVGECRARRDRGDNVAYQAWFGNRQKRLTAFMTMLKTGSES